MSAAKTKAQSIIDDNAEIHSDIRKILGTSKPAAALDELEASAGAKTAISAAGTLTPVKGQGDRT